MTGLLDPADALEELQVLEFGCVPGVDYSDKPNEWLTEYLAEYAWKIQREIWLSVAENRATAVLSCNNSGKTWLAARIVVWWILTNWRGGVRVVTTAPTAAQVTLLLWQEIRAAYNKAKALGKPVPGKIIGSPYPQWKIGDVTAAFGRKPADHEQSAMQGVHARRVLAVIDEAGGVAQPIWDAVDKIMTNEGARALVIGNPDNRAAPFGKVTQPGSGWHVIRIDGLRTPNFTAEIVGSGRYPFTRALMEHEGIPFNDEVLPPALEETMREHLLHPLWVEERFTRWCGLQPELLERVAPDELGQVVADAAAGSQLFTAAVRGDFPESSGNSVIPLGWYRRAVERWKDWEYGDKRLKVPARAEPAGRRIIGVDVATTNGADETCIAPRQGHVVYGVHRYSEGDTHETARHALEFIGPSPATAIAVVDGIGIGAGVRDVLRHNHQLTAVSFEAYNQSGRRDRHDEFGFLNDRAAAWWRLREMLDPTYGATLCLPPDAQLEVELTSPTWTIRSSTKGGVIQVESKDELRKRLGHSTDSADAVIHSTWIDGGTVNQSRPAPDAVTSGGPVVPRTPQAGDPVPSGAGESGAIPYKLDDEESGRWR